MKDILNYQQNPTQENADILLQQHAPTIQKHITKWSGTLPDIIIQRYAKKYALDAFKSYDPSKGAAVNTHLFNHLSKLSRLNYDNQNTVKIPEHQIRQISAFALAKDSLADTLGRDPSRQEIADNMSIPLSHVDKLAKNIRVDYTFDSDSDFQTQDDTAFNPQSLYIKDTVSKLSNVDKMVFNDLTGQNKQSKPLSPAEIGKKYKLKSYEVSRVKSGLAKKFSAQE